MDQAPGARGLLMGPELLAVLPAHGRYATAKIGNANHPIFYQKKD
jgi:hypothetical protein